eukprot:1160133-Pelagomonas_calceolata.AAC.10
MEGVTPWRAVTAGLKHQALGSSPDARSLGRGMHLHGSGSALEAPLRGDSWLDLPHLKLRAHYAPG